MKIQEGEQIQELRLGSEIPVISGYVFGRQKKGRKISKRC